MFRKSGSGRSGTLKLKINNISSYMKQVGKQARSPPQHVAGIEWHVLAYPSVVDKITRLSCFLVGENSCRWTAWVDATFRIVKDDGGLGEEASFRRKLLGKEPLKTPETGRLLSAGSGFVVDDFVEIRVDFSVSDVCGASFDVFETDGALAADIKLKVGDSIFHANKGYLSVVSSVFRDTFALTEGKKDIYEIELKDLEVQGVPRRDLSHSLPHPRRERRQSLPHCGPLQRTACDSGCKRHLLSASKVPGFDKLKLSVDLNRDDLRKLLSADRGIVVDHSVEIRAGLSVADTDGALFNGFETAKSLAADIKLKYLSVVSSVLRDMLGVTAAAGAEQIKKEMEELELKDLDVSEFKEFLGVKLKLAAGLSRDHLKKHLISRMTCDDIHTVNQDENKKQLGMDVLEALMDAHIRICRP
ncbi:hypothetical protein AAVH_15753 [Aphelenchoides avenae]|nr:hypothetical protein AAVH_15753 [Aphelenchus avenae]